MKRSQTQTLNETEVKKRKIIVYINKFLLGAHIVQIQSHKCVGVNNFICI